MSQTVHETGIATFEKNPTLAELPLCTHNNLVILLLPMSLCVFLLIPLFLDCQLPFMEIFL